MWRSPSSFTAENTDGKLTNTLLLGAERIGRGFALPRHLHVVHEMSEHGVRVEVCPISNEILGLTPLISGHAVYSLPANNVSCTISTDNGTLFGVTLNSLWRPLYRLTPSATNPTSLGLSVCE